MQSEGDGLFFRVALRMPRCDSGFLCPWSPPKRPPLVNP